MEESDLREHLDPLRIARLSAIRRAAFRSRSYCIIGCVACAGTAAELIYMAIVHAFDWHSMLYYFGALGMLWLTWICFRWALSHHRETRRTNDDSRVMPPDFSTLSDGSQIARHLDEMTRDSES